MRVTLLILLVSTAATAMAQTPDAAMAELPGMTGAGAYESGDTNVQPRASTGNRSIDRQAKRQASGDYDQIGTLKPAGLYQEAWNAPLRNKGVNQRQPGYVRYDYAFDNVYPVVVREGMITSIRFPVDETITRAYPGNGEAFETDAPAANIIALRARYPGTDTSLTAYGASGRVYNFYVRAVGVNAKFTTDFMVDIAGSTRTAENGGNGVVGALGSSATIGGGAAIANTPDGGPAQDYLDRLPFRPWEVINDLEIYVPKGASAGPMPRAVFRDATFTYVDYGEETARQMVEWPVASLVIQGVETTVGFRTAGPGGRMIVVEAVGDIILRNGNRIVAIKMKGKKPLPQLARRPAVSQPVAASYVQQSSTGAPIAIERRATAALPAAPAYPLAQAYRLDLGAGEASALPALYQTLKGESPDVLGRLEARATPQGGETRLKSSPVASLEEGIRICQTLASRGRVCAVEQAP